VSVLDYQSTQLKLMPLLATAYCLHFAKDHLVGLYCDMKRTKDALLIEEVHSLRWAASSACVMWMSHGVWNIEQAACTEL
jgi:hypothetical protein